MGAFGLANEGLGTWVVSIDPCDGEPQWTGEYTEGNRTNFSGGLGVDGDRLFVSGHMATHQPNGRAWLVRLDLWGRAESRADRF